MAGQMNGKIRNFGLLSVHFILDLDYYNSSLKSDGGHSIEYGRRASNCFGHAGFYSGF
jgi:hypothetical protein